MEWLPEYQFRIYVALGRKKYASIKWGSGRSRCEDKKVKVEVKWLDRVNQSSVAFGTSNISTSHNL